MDPALRDTWDVLAEYNGTVSREIFRRPDVHNHNGIPNIAGNALTYYKNCGAVLRPGHCYGARGTVLQDDTEDFIAEHFLASRCDCLSN